MKIFAEHDNRFEGLELKTGLFLLLAAFLIAAGIIAALVRQGVFTQTTPLHLRIIFVANPIKTTSPLISPSLATS